ncbi:hypothetical protein ACWDR0_32940, partial [Streptomyces sp. NPDC003691]
DVLNSSGFRGQHKNAFPQRADVCSSRRPGSYMAVATRNGTTAVIGDLAGQHSVHWTRADSGGVW